MYYKLRLKLFRWRKYIKARGRKAIYRMSGRRSSWRVYYETDSKRIVSITSIWPWLTPLGLSYKQYEREPNRRQALCDLNGVFLPAQHHGRAAYVRTYHRAKQ